MPKQTFGLYRLLLGVLIVAASFSILLCSFSNGFRLSSSNWPLAWQANNVRLMIVFAAGFASCAGFSALKNSISLISHIRVYLCLVVVAATIMLAVIGSFPIYGIALAVLAALVISIYLSRKLQCSSGFGRLTIGFSMYAALLITIVTYFAASAYADGFGGLVLWLLAGGSIAASSAIWALALLAVLTLCAIFFKDSDSSVMLLIAVGLGLLGPIVLLVYLVPALVKPLSQNRTVVLLVSGLIGGAFLAATATINSMVFGGYAPPLAIPIAFALIPVLLLRCRLQQPVRIAHSMLPELALLVLIAIVSISLLLHIKGFAHGLI